MVGGFVDIEHIFAIHNKSGYDGYRNANSSSTIENL